MRRRSLLAAGVLPLFGCAPDEAPLAGGWVGAAHQRGHRLRDRKSGEWPAPSVQRRAEVVVIGAGIAGLSCARALIRDGLDDVHLLELEEAPGGNSRGHQMGGMACPLGAHYLPLPGDDATEVIALLEELGLRRTEHGRAVYDERHLCHSPQERLFIDGHWHEGLLLPIDALPPSRRAGTAAQYRRLAQEVARAGGFSMPTARSAWTDKHAALDAQTFTQWLDDRGFDAPALRWYLDYCCRDDYGAGAAQVSAWAGLHYFASRHGFHAPGDEADAQEAVLTWPEGNAWLATRMAAPLAERIHCGRVALRVDESRHEVQVDAWDAAAQRTERWTARHVVLAVPLFIAARLIATPPPALGAAAAQMQHAPWLVANLHLEEPLADRPGAAPAWDNVRYGSPALGYVDAMHQSLRPHPGPTVLTAYWALGGDDTQHLKAQRRTLLDEPWQAWAARVLADLRPAHPDLRAKTRQIDLMRYGHAMSIPRPGVRGSPALRALAESDTGRLHFAHADLSAYSVFEEAMFHGERAAAGIARLSRLVSA